MTELHDLIQLVRDSLADLQEWSIYHDDAHSEAIAEIYQKLDEMDTSGPASLDAVLESLAIKQMESSATGSVII